MPVADIVGDKLYMRDVRNFTWRTATDFSPGFYDRVYGLNAIDAMYYVVVLIRQFDGVAHVFVCFWFLDGRHVAVSVEGRRVTRGIPGRPVDAADATRRWILTAVAGAYGRAGGQGEAGGPGIWRDVAAWGAASPGDERRADR